MSQHLLDRPHGRFTDTDTSVPSLPEITPPTGSDTLSEISRFSAASHAHKSHNALWDRWFTGGIYVLMLASGLSAVALFSWMCRP